jgi:hypothetical protein
MDTTHTALTALRTEVDRLRAYRSSDDLTAIEGNEFRVRYLGAWENPVEAEDDEDYDWQVPTAATVARLDALVADYSRRYGVRLTWTNDGEKNWITFAAK